MQQTSPLPASAKKERIAAFDLISIIACVFVCIVHFNASVCGWNGTFIIPENSVFRNYVLGSRVYLGSLGVSMFFILSGARLMYNYKGVRNFYKKRLMNIYPMFWIAFCTATIIDVLANKGYTAGNPLLLIASALGMDGYLGSLGFISMEYYKLGEWFLGCILLMYLVFPLIYEGVRRCPLFTSLVAVTIYAIFVHRCPEQSFFLRFPEMILGMLFIKYDGEKHPWIILGASGVWLLVCCVLRNYAAPLTLCVALAVFLFCILIALGKLIRHEKVKKVLAFASSLTYPVFLVHHWLIYKAANFFGISGQIQPRYVIWLMFLGFVVLTIALAWLLSLAGKKLQSNLAMKKA